MKNLFIVQVFFPSLKFNSIGDSDSDNDSDSDSDNDNDSDSDSVPSY